MDVTLHQDGSWREVSKDVKEKPKVTQPAGAGRGRSGAEINGEAGLKYIYSTDAAFKIHAMQQ